MIAKIAELLRDEISSLNFVEIAAGLAKPHTVRVNNTDADADEPSMIDKIIPMAYNDLGLTCEEGDLYALVPNTKKKSIVWWEDNGIEMNEEQTYYYQCTASLMCVCWFNLPLINQYLTEPSVLIANIIAALPSRLTNVDYLSQIRVAFTGEVVSGAEVLSRYNFDEAENQFSTFPYAVAGINVSVDFAFGKNCVDCLSILPSTCPPKMSYDAVLDLCEFVVDEGASRAMTVGIKVTSGHDCKIAWNDEDCTVDDIVSGTTNYTSEMISDDDITIQLVGEYTYVYYLYIQTSALGAGTRETIIDLDAFSVMTLLQELRCEASTSDITVTGDIGSFAAMTSMIRFMLTDTDCTGDINVIANFPNATTIIIVGSSGVSYTTTTFPDYNFGISITIVNSNLSTAEIDQFLIDLDAGVTNAGICNYSVGNDPVSGASAAARASLIAKGWALA